MSILIKKFTSLAVFTSLLSITNLIVLDSAQAYYVNFANGDFQDSGDTLNNGSGWEGTGSTDIRGTYSTIDPFPNDAANTLQGVITTACPGTIQTGECTDDDNNSLPRNDDAPTSAGTFNLLGQDQIGATNNIPALQTALGLSANAFSIPREVGDTPILDSEGNPLYRTPKEGSAIYQEITVLPGGDPAGVLLEFNWDFLTNDGEGSEGDKDFGFISISGSGYEQVIVLEDSTGTIPTASGTDFATNTAPYAAYVSEVPLAPGDYVVAFGVVDVDGVSNSSALLIDNFSAREVPFDFSPSTGLLLMTGVFGIRSKYKALAAKGSLKLKPLLSKEYRS